MIEIIIGTTIMFGPAGGRGPSPRPGYENVSNVAVTDIPPLPPISSYTTRLADIEVEPSVPFNLLTPTTILSNVTFNEDLKVKFIKHEEHPELLRQLALEIINNISPRALVIYTDGSKSDSGRTGSGIFMKTSTREFRYRFRNPDHSSVFRSELTAISEALSLALDFKIPDFGPAGGRGPSPRPGYENVSNVAVTDIPPLPLFRLTLRMRRRHEL
ncbi:putative RNA-directed DNA polymerase from transposon BS [Caerostris extrusa]|uniref:RNA-directed DNA polymerase from transposon BS n=1 Tax=Caerostris extrusa TaxID=172846 RepID=A0AAV4TRG8_CAEEX|nr:putative RNA-directed DNA polymerase from transposon BS [Caerostris extrusa]